MKRYLNREHQRRLATMMYQATLGLTSVDRGLVLDSFATQLSENNDGSIDQFLNRIEDLLEGEH